ncbi:glycosyltransferase family 8 protein [Fastidiosipila sanguinis]|uniref:Glycosyltransferase family 8 protein n=1 Tax=Fastidiosipila sanguinis TaxID=236753 RepID=A0A2S0KND6_9FIRM|nr:glycosyltransferase family 8 protein [Fastidiosipila sanguinis]AVM42546.1 glycosyltransferase family 8 protein [Fastidiosipila sanguinis]
MNILVTFDENYAAPFKTMLKSLAINNASEKVVVYLLYSENKIRQETLEDLIRYCGSYGVVFKPCIIDNEIFSKYKVNKHYSSAMYYRLLASEFLPKDIDRIIYLDPDILIINSLSPLWKLELKDKKIFAAASHTEAFTDSINMMRLNTETEYFNTGVLLMDLKSIRDQISFEELVREIEEVDSFLILPDQDIFNVLFSDVTLSIPDEIWNYDARYYSKYLLQSNREYDLDWVMKNTVILHFCGKKKPWNTKNINTKFDSLYKHYMQLENPFKKVKDIQEK